MSAVDIDALCEALGREEAVYREMLDLSRRQIDALENGAPGALEAIVVRKNALMERLGGFLASSEPLKKAWQSARDGAGAAERERAEGALGRVREVLEQILAWDERTRALMEGMKAEVQRSLKQVQGSRQVAKAYKQAQPPPEARFKDTET
jgi:hypothetical protein